MVRMDFDFTRLERDVLSAICEMYPLEKALLEAQLATASLRNRENTGLGFFTNFQVARDGVPPIGGQRLRNGPDAKIAGIEHGMSFILWLADGYANCLEGYCYGSESTAQMALETLEFEIRNG